MSEPDKISRHPIGMILAYTGVGVALAAVTAALLAGLGNRWGWWDYRNGFLVLTFAAWGGVAATALSLFALVVALRAGWRRGVVLGIHGVVIGALVFGVPAFKLIEGRKLPPIHDITTDPANPPRLVAVLPLRKNAPNTAEYGGAAIAEQQRKSYPDITPLMLEARPAAAYESALKTARNAGWEIVAAVPEESRIEATATTLLFGFKDDIVVRITPAGSGSRVDVRSVSRVGRSDLGANANRVREFLRDLASGKTG
jgi:uncharacterized protein (DUF1499 family)